MTLFCRIFGVRVTYRWILDWMIGFIDTLYIELVIKINYSAIAVPTLDRSLLHTLSFSVYYTLH
jgi:hypothetical protein